MEVYICVIIFIGPSEVRAPAEQLRKTTILGNFSFLLFFLIPIFKTPEGVVVGFQIFAWAPN